jgi:hypothetical protein
VRFFQEFQQANQPKRNPMKKTKKKTKLRDMKPRKDTKGGGGFKPNSGGTDASGKINPNRVGGINPN